MPTATGDVTREPVYWFVVLDKAMEAGDLQKAMQATEQLRALGVHVRYGRRRCAWFPHPRSQCCRAYRRVARSSGQAASRGEIPFWLGSAQETRRPVARLWRPRPRRRRQVRTHGDSRGFALLASCGWDKTIRLWDTTTGKEIRTLTGPKIGVRCVAFTPDGQQLAAGDRALPPGPQCRVQS